MKIVIAGSAKLQNEINKWVEYWNNQKNCSVLNYPKEILAEDEEKMYPKVHKKFFEDIAEADILFVANEDKKGITGYIGAETFAELSYGLILKTIYKKDIKLILAKRPSKEVACYDEIVLWEKFGWIDEIIN